MTFTIVTLSATNEISHRGRAFPTYATALGYLEHNLPKRPNLDMIDGEGRFVGWELTPTPCPTTATSFLPISLLTMVSTTS